MSNEHVKVEPVRVLWGARFRATCSRCGWSGDSHVGQPFAPYEGWEEEMRRAAQSGAEDAAAAHHCPTNP